MEECCIIASEMFLKALVRAKIVNVFGIRRFNICRLGANIFKWE
jgi:hypothetical protein